MASLRRAGTNENLSFYGNLQVKIKHVSAGLDKRTHLPRESRPQGAENAGKTRDLIPSRALLSIPLGAGRPSPSHPRRASAAPPWGAFLCRLRFCAELMELQRKSGAGQSGAGAVGTRRPGPQGGLAFVCTRRRAERVPMATGPAPAGAWQPCALSGGEVSDPAQPFPLLPRNPGGE